MKSIRRIIIFFSLTLFVILVVLGMFSTSWAATYYVDATGGNDNNNGLSPTTAWQTIAKVNASSFDPGDQILFKRGEIWRAQLIVRSSGNSGNPITFGTYGSGVNPAISAANDISGDTWTAKGGNVWRKNIGATEPRILLFNDKSIGVVDATPDADYEWIYSNPNLDVYAMSTPNSYYSKIEASQRRYAVTTNGKSNIIFDGITFQLGNAAGTGSLYITGASGNITVKNCEISYGANHGIYINSSDSTFTFTGNKIQYNGWRGAGNGSGISFWAHTGATVGKPILINHNTVNNNRGSGIAIVTQYAIVEYNHVHDNGSPRSTDSGIKNHEGRETGDGNNNIIRYNLIYNQVGRGNDGNGIQLEFSTNNNDVYGNVIYNNDGAGIDNYDSNNNNIYNNTVYGNCQNSSGELYAKGEIRITSTPGRDNSTNVVVKNNIGYSTVLGAYAIWVDGHSYDNAGLVIDTNVWYRTSGDWYYWNASGGADLATWNALANVGKDLNSDPLFFDASNNDFTIKQSSPCIDAGTDVGLTQDFSKTPIPQGDGVDIGAFEYNRLSPPKNFQIIIE